MTGTDYVAVTTYLGLLDTCGTNAQYFLNNIDDLVIATSASSTNPSVGVMLSSANQTAETTVTNKYENVTGSLQDVVASIQSYMIQTYGSVEGFLESRGLVVTTSFAALSSSCGFPIEPEFVGP